MEIKGDPQMNTFHMTAGTYYITDACSTHDGYYMDFLLSHEWEDEGSKLGSTFIKPTGFDGSGFVRDMDNNIIGEWGSDAANVSVVPAKLCPSVPAHYGTMIEMEDDFIIKVYHDAIVIGDRYRVRL